MTTTSRARLRQCGFSLLEVTVVSVILMALAILTSAVLTSGSRTARYAFGEQSVTSARASLLDTVAAELRLADPASVVFSLAAADTISFQRILGYDDVTATRVLSGTITIRKVALPQGGFGVERSEVDPVTSNVETRLLGAGVAGVDAESPGEPGLHFDVRQDTECMFLDVFLTIVPAVDATPQLLQTTVCAMNE